MEYGIENEYLKVTVSTDGAEVTSVIRKSDGTEHIWSADPDVWGYHAPILFPYTGRVKDNVLEARGRRFTDMPQHGFARNLEHRFVSWSDSSLSLELTDSEESRKMYPYAFRLVSTFTLEGETLHHTLTVENRDDDTLYAGIGFHPAFALPFDEAHQAEDYELRFDTPQSPLCIGTLPKGLTNGTTYYLGKNIRSIPLDEHLFENDSHCMLNLTAKTLGLYEKNTGRGVVCSLEGFPYTLIWSKPGVPQFVCIEPWCSIPSPEDGSCAIEEKPAAMILEPGQSQSVTLSTAFIR